MPTSGLYEILEHEPVIDTNLLIAWGGVYKQYNKGEIIFREDGPAVFYHQIEEGQVKMVNCNEDGKEFIQGIFTAGECFGEPPLFFNGTYPAAAVAETNCAVIRLRKEIFFEILKDSPDVHLRITINLSRRLQLKAIIAREMACFEPEHRIETLFELAVEKYPAAYMDNAFKVPYTRQQIADMCGLRVETVIRTIKLMEEKGKVAIKTGKVYWLQWQGQV